MLNTQDESRVRIAKVDCTENQKTCSGNEVTSYPTLKFFKLNSEEEAIKYRSTRDLPSLTQFINDQLGSSIPKEDEEDTDETIAVPAPLKGLIELTDKNFAAQTATGNWFIKFYGKAADNFIAIKANPDLSFKSFQPRGAVTARNLLQPSKNLLVP